MYYYNNELPPQQGWICPKCGRVNAPWLPTCGCVSSQTRGTPYLVKTSSISRDSHEIAKDDPQKKYPTEWCEECDLWRDNNCMGVAQCKANMQALIKIYEASKDEPQTCETCKYGQDKHRYAHICNECGVGINNYTPQTERSE